jgi:hypothetical protein
MLVGVDGIPAREETVREWLRSRPLVTDAANVVSLLTGIVTVVPLLRGRGGWLLTGSVAAVLFGGSALGLIWLRGPAKGTWWRVALAAVVVLFGAAGLGAGAERAAHREAPGGEPQVELRFEAVGESVPYCRTYAGTGTVPQGYQLLLFDRGDTDEPGAPYYFHGQAERRDGGWAAPRIGIGLAPTAADPRLDEGARIILYAQLVREETALVLRDRGNIVIFPEKPENQWLLRDLPGVTKDKLRLTRAVGPGDCTPA